MGRFDKVRKTKQNTMIDIYGFHQLCLLPALGPAGLPSVHGCRIPAFLKSQRAPLASCRTFQSAAHGECLREVSCGSRRLCVQPLLHQPLRNDSPGLRPVTAGGMGFLNMTSHLVPRQWT